MIIFSYYRFNFDMNQPYSFSKSYSLIDLCKNLKQRYDFEFVTANL